VQKRNLKFRNTNIRETSPRKEKEHQEARAGKEYEHQETSAIEEYEHQEKHQREI
jgi:hypothetical protein